MPTIRPPSVPILLPFPLQGLVELCPSHRLSPNNEDVLHFRPTRDLRGSFPILT